MGGAGVTYFMQLLAWAAPRPSAPEVAVVEVHSTHTEAYVSWIDLLAPRDSALPITLFE